MHQRSPRRRQAVLAGILAVAVLVPAAAGRYQAGYQLGWPTVALGAGSRGQAGEASELPTRANAGGSQAGALVGTKSRLGSSGYPQSAAALMRRVVAGGSLSARGARKCAD
jgi:hypothetical protein